MKILFIMDPLNAIAPEKDSSVALIEEGVSRGHEIYYAQLADLFMADNRGLAYAAPITSADQAGFAVAPAVEIALGEFYAIFMRKDPPVDKAFLQATYILDQACMAGVKVINNPAALRHYNEKIYATHFADYAPKTLIAANKDIIREFVLGLERAILKPLDMMGGHGVFVSDGADANLDVIIEMLTENGRHQIIVQKFLPEIVDGDRRLIMVNGQLMDHSLVRYPKSGSLRGNMAAGGSYQVEPVNARDQELAALIGPRLINDGVFFAGLDVIGGQLIEINHTSPTGLRQIAQYAGENIAAKLWNQLDL